MKKQVIKKLKLKSETVKALSAIQLNRVVGGVSLADCSAGLTCPGTNVNCPTATGCATNCLCTYAQSICRCTAVGCSLYPTCGCGAG